MKKEKITSFLSGVVSCTLVLGLATTALAATGNMSFGRVNVRLTLDDVSRPVFGGVISVMVVR